MRFSLAALRELFSFGAGVYVRNLLEYAAQNIDNLLVGRLLGVDALGDQTAAGGIAWAFSEIPSVIVLVALLFQWYTSEQRQARRKDRAADRDGDAELVAYNAYLASLEARGRG